MIRCSCCKMLDDQTLPSNNYFMPWTMFDHFATSSNTIWGENVSSFSQGFSLPMSWKYRGGLVAPVSRLHLYPKSQLATGVGKFQMRGDIHLSHPPKTKSSNQKEKHRIKSYSLLSHLVKTCLKSFMSWVYSPDHLKALFSLFLHYVSQQCLKFFILVIPCGKHFKASHHDLQ